MNHDRNRVGAPGPRVVAGHGRLKTVIRWKAKRERKPQRSQRDTEKDRRGKGRKPLAVRRVFGPSLLPAFWSSFLGDLCVLCGQNSCLAFGRIVDWNRKGEIMARCCCNNCVYVYIDPEEWPAERRQRVHAEYQAQKVRDGP
jgi:hypothetical protein